MKKRKSFRSPALKGAYAGKLPKTARYPGKLAKGAKAPWADASVDWLRGGRR